MINTITMSHSQLLQSLNTFQVQTVRAINDLREEVKENKREIKKSREIEEAHWQENLRRWNENDKKWQENDKRWEENKKQWEENHKAWQEYRRNRKKDRNDILDILVRYDISISEQLHDTNAKKMRKLV